MDLMALAVMEFNWCGDPLEYEFEGDLQGTRPSHLVESVQPSQTLIDHLRGLAERWACLSSKEVQPERRKRGEIGVIEEVERVDLEDQTNSLGKIEFSRQGCI